ncbi:MAG: ATP-binding protein [Dehalococcoidia bacterium]|nr:MAG: ATP-binding protein [Dehalococcoidia bacterium]
MSQLVVQMHGEPGSGKSTVARAIAPRIGAVVLDKDVIKAALLRAGIDEGRAGPAAYFAQAESIVELGHSLILDNPVFWATVEQRWLAICERANSHAVLIECVCGDEAELRRRLTTRDALESQPRAPLELTRHPGAAATSFQPRLVVDTTRPLAESVDEALAYISADIALPSLQQVATGRS